jgi:hypothetical protein
MAASSDSQGLKIAVAILVSLSVILAVLTYFGFSSYSQSEARALLAQKNERDKGAAADLALRQLDELRRIVGVRAEGADLDTIKNEVKAETKKVEDTVASTVAQVNEYIAKAEQAGATAPEIAQAKANVEQIYSAYTTEPNKNYISTLDRLANVLKNQALLTSSLALNYIDLRHKLEAATAVNKSSLDVESQALAKAKADLEGEHKKHEQERSNLLAKVDQYQTAMNQQATDINNLNTRIRNLEEDYGKRLTLSQNTLKEYRDQLDKEKTVTLDVPDGYLTYVDYYRSEVRTNLTRKMGARPQMKLAIFDARAPGVPNEQPKGSIELTYVNDTYSIGKIVRTINSIDPLRVGDIVYSPSWSPNQPMRFALIGKIDVNRDGKDDRADLKRMIEAAGGIVDYDLPPPDVGKEQGKLSGLDAWYVVDERTPFRDPRKTQHDIDLVDSEYEQKKAEALREARLNGVRPMPIGRLLNYLGYDYRNSEVGRSEGVNKAAARDLLAPQTKDEGKTSTKAAAPAGKAETEDMPKDEAKESP